MKRQAFVFAILALAAGYIFADAYDYAPGLLTVRPAEAEAAAYPQITEFPEPAAAPTASFDAPIPDTQAVQAILDEFAADCEHVVGNISALVIDAVSGEELGAIEPDTARVPASNMKVATAFLALKVLGPDATFPTRIALEGDTLYLIGGGDVLLSPQGAEATGAWGHASIEDLAEQCAKELAARGITEVKLRVDSTLFESPLYHEGVLPSNHVYVMEARPLGTKETSRTEMFAADPDMRVAQLLAERLGTGGVTFESVERSESPAPATASEIARVESADVRTLVDYMLTYSDNSTAETLTHLAAIERGKPATFAGGADALREVLSEEGIATEGMEFADGSGLSQDNKVTARFLVALADAVRTAHGGELGALAAGLPVGGYNGTLNNRFMDDGMGGLVHAKTGSLSDVRSLSGYLQTKEGRLLEFAVMVDEIPEKTVDDETGEERFSPDPRPRIDEALTAIAALP